MRANRTQISQTKQAVLEIHQFLSNTLCDLTRLPNIFVLISELAQNVLLVLKRINWLLLSETRINVKSKCSGNDEENPENSG